MLTFTTTLTSSPRWRQFNTTLSWWRRYVDAHLTLVELGPPLLPLMTSSRLDNANSFLLSSSTLLLLRQSVDSNSFDSLTINACWSDLLSLLTSARWRSTVFDCECRGDAAVDSLGESTSYRIKTTLAAIQSCLYCNNIEYYSIWFVKNCSKPSIHKTPTKTTLFTLPCVSFAAHTYTESMVLLHTER